MNAPKKVTWIIALILTVVCLFAHFFGDTLGLNTIPVVKEIVKYVGEYGCTVSAILLLLACLFKGL